MTSRDLIPLLLPLLMGALLATGCATTAAGGDRGGTVGLPRAPIPHDVRSEVTAAVHGRRPSRVLGDLSDHEVGSPDAAVAELVRQFPEYGRVVECWTEERDHYVLSVHLAQAPDHAYRVVVFVPVGGRIFRLYLAARSAER